MKSPWQSVDPLGAREYAQVKRAAIFQCCKWDPQVEDVCTLSPQPVVLSSQAWSELVSLSEKLARETFAAETAILQRPHLWKSLGLPWTLRRRMAGLENASDAARHLRLIRFDFHFTTEGWRISEANSDVPGGFNEASGFTRLMARHYRGMASPGDPTEKLAQAIGTAATSDGIIALAHATAFADDRQVMVFLERYLRAAGHKTALLAPDHLRWENRTAFLAADWANGPVAFCFRFFPADWLTALPYRCQWWHLLGNSRTPLCNPASTILTQSKRFPLTWNGLPLHLPTWEALLPKTFDVRDLGRRGISAESVVFKPAFGRVGDMIKMPGVTAGKEADKINRSIRRYPGLWVAQECFKAVPMPTATGDLFPCIGVYTLDGAVIGAYGRLARRPLVDHLAQDAAVLIAQTVSPQLTQQPDYDDTIRTLQPVGA